MFPNLNSLYRRKLIKIYMFYAQGPLLIILDNTITDKKYRMRILLGVSFFEFEREFIRIARSFLKINIIRSEL